MSVLKKHTVGKNIPWIVEEYHSFEELLRFNRTRQHLHNEDTINSREFDEDWMGVKSYSEAENLLRYGWDKHVPELKKYIDKTKINGTTVKRMRTEQNVTGFAPIVSNAILGLPNSMLNTVIKPIKTKVISIMYDITTPCGFSPKTILQIGLKLMRTIIVLESKGYRVRLQAMQSYSDSKSADMLMVRVKNENQPLDCKRIMFPLIHPGMFRAIGFAWWERCPGTKAKGGYGHFMAAEYGEKKTRQYMKEVFGKDVKYINCGELTDLSEEQIEERILQNLF